VMSYHHERLTTLLDGHERAFRWFGGVTLSCLYDNSRNLVLDRREHKVLCSRSRTGRPRSKRLLTRRAGAARRHQGNQGSADPGSRR
jgi:transposase